MDDSRRFDHYMKKLKLTFSKNEYKELLDKIDRANRDLREDTHQKFTLALKKRIRRSGRLIAQLKLIRKHAASLYQLLMNDKTWKSCTCKMHHLASLRLEARPHSIEDVRADILQKHAFRILLSVTDEHDGTAQWKDIEIIPSTKDLATVQRPQTSPDPLR